jgi:excisionase family DNA binding protein
MPRLFTLIEAAQQLRLSPRTVRRLAREGRIRAARLVKGRLLFAEDELARAVREAQAPAPTAE